MIMNPLNPKTMSLKPTHADVPARITAEPAPDSNPVLSWALFLISPVLALWAALTRPRESWGRNVLWMFVVFYGLTLVIASEGVDAAAYRNTFFHMRNTGMSFPEFLNTLYNPMYGKVDVLSGLITFLVASVTSNYHILFAVFGLTFGFFYSRNLWYLLQHSQGSLNWIAWLYLLGFACIVGFWNINGFRFWCAAHIFFYGAMPYIFQGKRAQLWWIPLTMLMHFSFIIPSSLLLLYIIAGNRTQWYFWFFILTFFVNSINLELLGQWLQQVVPAFLERKAAGYTNPEYAESVASQVEKMNFYARLYTSFLQWCVLIALVYIHLFLGRKLSMLPGYFNLYGFCLFFLGFANLLSLIPSGERFTMLGYMFAIGLIFFLYVRYKRIPSLRRTWTIVLPLLLFFVLISLRVAADSIGVMTLAGNPIAAFFFGQDRALIELIK